ncbi:MAG: saccharopine dehydrogenase NADP-binding domain-containing protein [Candidatus Obscuribacterales bacterium]|nr:saccharopine dehydrogenase NADP-binding domain-containing protein [Candidatus Obscuribacterales bacterium]
MTWMLYGANGYTGKLIARLAKEKGLKPILAGRNSVQVEQLGKELDMPWRAFSLLSSDEIASNLQGVDLVLHCAGPFSATFRPMFNACLKAKVHYLDVTGEIGVFEELFSRNSDCVDAGITAICGVGFDVVPTDCLAAMVKERLPETTQLRLGIAGVGAGISRGTAKTMFEGTAHGGCIRQDGKLVKVPLAYKTTKFHFNHKNTISVTMPWGDLATAYRSTGIPNIEVYFATTTNAIMFMRLAELFRPLLASPPVQIIGKQIISKYITGPTDEGRSAAKCVIVADGKFGDMQCTLRMRCPEGYTLTSHSALTCVERLLAGGIATGALTPSMAFGADVVNAIPGIEIETLN